MVNPLDYFRVLLLLEYSVTDKYLPESTTDAETSKDRPWIDGTAVNQSCYIEQIYKNSSECPPMII